MPVRQIIKPPIFKKNITLNFGGGCNETAVIFVHILAMSLRTRFFSYTNQYCNRRKTHVRTPRAKERFFFFWRQLSLLLKNMLNYPWTMHRRTGSNSDQIFLENNSIANHRSKSAPKNVIRTRHLSTVVIDKETRGMDLF